MSSSIETKSPAKGTTGTSTLAGVGSGTGLTAWAQTLPESFLKTILVYGAPALTVAFTVGVFYLQVVTAAYAQNRRIARFSRTMEQYLANPNTSDAHKAELRRNLEEVQQLRIRQDMDRIRLLGMVGLPVPERASAAGATPPGEA